MLEAPLRQGPWPAGSAFSVADIMNFGWLDASGSAGVSLADYPAVQAWAERMRRRPGVQRGLAALA